MIRLCWRSVSGLFHCSCSQWCRPAATKVGVGVRSAPSCVMCALLHQNISEILPIVVSISVKSAELPFRASVIVPARALQKADGLSGCKCFGGDAGNNTTSFSRITTNVQDASSLDRTDSFLQAMIMTCSYVHVHVLLRTWVRECVRVCVCV